MLKSPFCNTNHYPIESGKILPDFYKFKQGSCVMNEFQSCSRALITAGQQLYNQDMVPATSGNFSARLDNNHNSLYTNYMVSPS